MEIDKWYDWSFVYLYFGGAVFTFIASIVLASKYRSKETIISSLGFFAFVLGAIMQVILNKEVVSLLQTNQDATDLVFQYSLWRAASSIGIVVGGLALLFHSFGVGK